MTIKDQGASINIKLSQIVPSKTNPRKHFPEEMLKEMAASIEQHGILQPILVRTPRNGKYEIVAGETRYRSALLTTLTEAPCLVRELTDFEAMELQVLENLHRNDLTPMEEAQGFKQLLDKSQDIAAYTIDELADKIGKSRTYVYDSLKLLELPDAAVTALNSGELNRSTALLVARLSPDVQTSALKKLSDAAEDGQSTSYRDAKALIAQEVKTSELNAALEKMIAECVDEGKTVIDLRNKANKDEWAQYGLSEIRWRKKSGYMVESNEMQSGDGYKATVSEVLRNQAAPEGTVYLAGFNYLEPQIHALYPTDQLWTLFNGAVASGQITKPQAPPVVKSAHEIKRERLDAESNSRRQYASDLMEAIIGNPKIAHTQIAIKSLLQVIVGDIDDSQTDYTLMAFLDINDQDAMIAAIHETADVTTLTQLSLCYFIACNASVPHYFFDDHYDAEEDEMSWRKVLEIAALYHFPPYFSETAEQPPTPPAAAQAQEDVAPEKLDPATEEVGELSEEEASLASGAPAAQAGGIDTRIVRTAAQARLDKIKEKELARRARKESAKADVSTPAPLAPATGETNSSEVAA